MHRVSTLKNHDGDFFHSKDQQNSEPGQKMDFFGYRSRAQNFLNWREAA